MRRLKEFVGAICDTGAFVLKWQDFATLDEVNTFVALEMQDTSNGVRIGYVLKQVAVAVPEMKHVSFVKPGKSLLEDKTKG